MFKPSCLLIGASLAASLLAGCGSNPASLALTPAAIAPQAQAAQPLPAVSAQSAPLGAPAPADSLPLSAQMLMSAVPDLATSASKPRAADEAPGKPLSGDLINLVVIGSQAQLDGAMQKAGWVHPDPITPESTAHMGWALLRHKAYPTAPVSNLYLFGRQQDLAWESNSADVHHRDHCRAWKSPLKDSDGQDVWLIAGTQDVGVEWDSHRHEPTHKINPDIDAERDLIVRSLQSAAVLNRVYQLPGAHAGQPYDGRNGGGDPFHTDGMVTAVEF